MPSSSSLPETAPPAQNPPGAGANHFEQMEAELKALQQQAQATQQSLQQLQTRTTVDPFTAIGDNLSSLAAVNSAMLGVASALLLASIAAWWYLWQRPRTRWIDAPRAAAPREAPPISSARAPLFETDGPSLYAPGNSTQPPGTQPPGTALHDDALSWDPSIGSGDTTQPFDPSSPFAKQDPNPSFDSEAAATEVMRVRKSLAEKREARAYMLEREEGSLPPPSPDDGLDLDLDLDEPAPPSAHAWLDDGSVAPEAPVPQAPQASQAPTPAAATQAELDAALELDLGLDPWRQPGETQPGANTDALAEEIQLSFTLEDYSVKPEHTTDQPAATSEVRVQEDVQEAVQTEPQFQLEAKAEAEHPMEQEPDPIATPHEPGTKAYDFTITMALAQESAALELWPEARDLATEVLESDDPALVSEALSLLERLNHLELNAPPNTNWNTMR